MTNTLGFAVFAIGVLLLIVGFAASEPGAAHLFRFVARHPGLHSLGLPVVGGAAVVCGLLLAYWGSRQS